MDHAPDMMQDLPWAPRHHSARFEATRIPPTIGLRGPLEIPELPAPPMPPAAPSARAAAALRAAVVPPTSPALHFAFKREYSNFFTNHEQKFVLREEHAAELKRLVAEHKRGRDVSTDPMTLSDIVNACLDFAFEHSEAFHARVNPGQLRESLARAVLKKAFVQFLEHDPQQAI